MAGMSLPVILASVCLLGAAKGEWGPPKGFPRPPITGVMDLDAKPQDRWGPHIDKAVATMGYEASLANMWNYWTEAVEPRFGHVAAALALSKHLLHPEYIAEIEGATLAYQKYNPKFTFTALLGMNLVYDLDEGYACTSIVAQDTLNGIWHGRNLDWPSPPNVEFANITISLNYTKGGKLLYRGVTYLGYVGLLTGMRPHGFAITSDERDTNVHNQMAVNVAHLLGSGALPSTWLTRIVLEQHSDYQSALNAMSTGRIAAPVYYIISGTKDQEGAVLSRNWDESVEGIYSIGDGPQPWYVLETNYDHWKQAPKRDDRRAVARKALAEVGKGGMSHKGMLAVMETPGNSTGHRGLLNHNTRYTVVLNPGKDLFYVQLDQ